MLRVPKGELTIQTLAMPVSTNANGDIFGGWIVSQMDLAAGVLAKKLAHGRVATVAINSMTFLKPVN
jgi:acyl-CoA thioesterase YciA